MMQTSTVRFVPKTYLYSLGLGSYNINRGTDSNGNAFSSPESIAVWVNRNEEQLDSYSKWTAAGFTILLYIYTSSTALSKVQKVTGTPCTVSGAKNSDRHHYEFRLYYGTPTIGSDNVTVTLGGAVLKDTKYVGISDNGEQGETGKDGTSVNIQGVHYGHYASVSAFTSATSTSTKSTAKVFLIDADNSGNYHCLARWVDSSNYVVTQASLGDGYIYDSDGHLWVAVSSGWKDVGEVRGVGIKSITEYFGLSAAKNIEPSSWQTDMPTATESNPYLWSYTYTLFTDGTHSQSVPRVIWEYKADARGIASITQYYARSDSNTTVPQKSAFQTSVPQINSTYRYLWGYTHYEYTDTTSEDSTPMVIGVYGESATTYDIETDADLIYVTKDGETTPDTVTATVIKTVGGTQSAISTSADLTNAGLTLTFSYAKSNGRTLTSINNAVSTTLDSIASALTIELKSGSQLLAKKVVGLSYGTGCLRLLKWSECEVGFQFYHGKGEPYADVVIHETNDKDSNGNNISYWSCKESHAKTLNTEPSTSGGGAYYWSPASSFDLVATRLLIAKRARIDNLVAEDIYVEDPATGQPTCYISSSGLMTEGDIKANTLTLNSRKLQCLSATQIAYLCGASASNASTLAGTSGYNAAMLGSISLNSIQLPSSTVSGIYGKVPPTEHTVSKALHTLTVGTNSNTGAVLWLPQLPAGTAFESKIMIHGGASEDIADYLERVASGINISIPLIFVGASYDNANGYVKVGIGADLNSFSRMMRTPCWPGKYHLIGWHEQLMYGNFLVWKKNDSSLVYENFYSQGNFYETASTDGTPYKRAENSKDTLTRVGENVTYWSIELVADGTTEGARVDFGKIESGGNSNSSGGVCIEVIESSSKGQAEYQTTMK